MLQTRLKFFFTSAKEREREREREREGEGGRERENRERVLGSYVRTGGVCVLSVCVSLFVYVCVEGVSVCLSVCV